MNAAEFYAEHFEPKVKTGTKGLEAMFLFAEAFAASETEAAEEQLSRAQQDLEQCQKDAAVNLFKDQEEYKELGAHCDNLKKAKEAAEAERARAVRALKEIDESLPWGGLTSASAIKHDIKAALSPVPVPAPKGETQK